MYNKHIRSFNKGIAIGVEAICALALLVSILWFALVIRLSYGPLNVNYLTNTIERAVNNENLGFNFAVGTTVLKWGEDNKGSLEFEIRDVHVSREDSTPILAIEKIGIQLSRRHLLIGKIIPKAIKIYGPALRIIRDEQGNLSLNVSKFVKDINDNESDINQGNVLKSVLLLLKDSEEVPFISKLEQISINDASILFEGRALGVNWKSKRSNIIFTKKRGGIAVDALAGLDVSKGLEAYFKGSLFYSWDTLKTNGVFYFSNINAAELSQQSKKLEFLSEMDLNLKGSVAFEMDPDLKLVYSRFVVGADKGIINVAKVYKKPVEVKDIYIKGKTDSYTKKTSIEEFRLSLGDALLSAKGSVEDGREGKVAILDAELQEFPINDLSVYWPDSLQDIARSWIVSNIREGVAHKATLHSILLVDNDFSKVDLIDINGNIDFSGAEVNYFSPLKRVTDVKGSAAYDDKSFNLDIKSGKLDDVDVTRADIKITDLDKVDDVTNALIDIDLSLNGSLITALKVIDSKPLRYPRALGLDINNFSGHNSMDLKLHFPLYQKLTVDEVKVGAKANVTNVEVKDVVEGFGLKSDSLSVYVDNEHISIDGKGLLENMPIDFKWKNNFSKKADDDSVLEAKINLTKNAMLKFGLPETFNLEGELISNIKYVVAKDKSAKMDFAADLYKASFLIPFVNYSKELGVVSKIKMLLHLNKDKKLEKISNISYNSNNNFAEGNIDISPKHDLAGLNFSTIRLNNNDFALSMKKNTTEDISNWNIVGKKIDVSDILSSHKKDAESGTVSEEKTTPLAVNIAVDELVTSSKGHHIDKTKIYMRINEWDRASHLEVDAEVGSKPLYVRYIPQEQGGYSLEFKAYNAGAALSALDVTDSVKGGRLEVRGFPDIKSGSRDLAGTVNISDFTLSNVPVLGMLLNAVSLSGVVELLNGKGIAFDKMGAKFWWKDKGMPESKKPFRKIVLKDGETSGASLGLTFDGDVDMIDKRINMNGTVIPASGISKVVGKIPLLGDILTGGDGGGIIAATYKIKGETKNPNVTVNPLSVLAPGVIRKLFFE